MFECADLYVKLSKIDSQFSPLRGMIGDLILKRVTARDMCFLTVCMLCYVAFCLTFAVAVDLHRQSRSNHIVGQGHGVR